MVEMVQEAEAVVLAEAGEDGEYSPLRFGKKSLQHLDDLLPLFMGVDGDLKQFREALDNGKISWKPTEVPKI